MGAADVVIAPAAGVVVVEPELQALKLRVAIAMKPRAAIGVRLMILIWFSLMRSDRILRPVWSPHTKWDL